MSWPKMGKMSDKITQDGGKMRKMRDVSSGLAPLGGVDTVWPLQQADEPRARGGTPLRVGKPPPS